MFFLFSDVLISRDAVDTVGICSHVVANDRRCCVSSSAVSSVDLQSALNVYVPACLVMVQVVMRGLRPKFPADSPTKYVQLAQVRACVRACPSRLFGWLNVTRH